MSKCKMKRVLRRFFNNLRIEQFDVVVDFTSSLVPTRTNVPTNYIRTSFPYLNKSRSLFSSCPILDAYQWCGITLFITAACCSNVIASKNNFLQHQSPVMTRRYSLRLLNQVRYNHVMFFWSRDSENFKISREGNFMLIKLVTFAFCICIKCH